MIEVCKLISSISSINLSMSSTNYTIIQYIQFNIGVVGTGSNKVHYHVLPDSVLWNVQYEGACEG